jgi:peptidoglycan/xylan/chitin deacetylase (PgdA/CDA1 family)
VTGKMTRTMKQLAILGYHKIGQPPDNGWETWYYISSDTFLEQLSFLSSSGWQVIDSQTMLRAISEPEILPERAAVLTFDDGYRSMREVAQPLLERFGYPAILFVPTAFVGRLNEFDAGNEPDEPLCDWDDLRALASSRVAIQSHGVSHRRFSELNEAQLLREIKESKSSLESQIGEAVELFSFPYGDDGLAPSATHEMLGRAGYRAACLYSGGVQLIPAEQRYGLYRIAMGPDTDLRSELSMASTTGP